MSLLSKAGLLARIRRSRESRAKLVASNLDKGVAFQIRATRDKRNWTQEELAAASGMRQNNISRLESSDYGKHTISSLKRIADALDVALVVRFVPFGQYIDWLSATPYLDEGIRPEALAVPSFEDEERLGRYDSNCHYFPVFVSSKIATSIREAKPVLGSGFSEPFSLQIVPKISNVPAASGGYANASPYLHDAMRKVS